MNQNLPEEIRTSFLKKGVDPDQALFLVKSDMAREELFCDAYTVFTKEGISTLFCLEALEKREGASFFSRNKLQKVFKELDYCFYFLEEIESIRIEEQVSVVRVVLEKKSGEAEHLFWASFACRKKLFEFAEIFNAYRETGVLGAHGGEKHGKEDQNLCPRCGKPYADPEKRICKSCSGKRNLVKKLLPFFFRYRKQLALVFLTVFLSGALSVLTPYLNSKVLYDEVLTPTSPLYGKIFLLVVSVALAALLNAVVNMVNTMVGSRVAAYVSYDLKKTIFSSFERLSFSFFTSRHTGKLITQINADAETLYWFFCDGVPYFLTNVLQMLGIGIVMLSIHPWMTLLIVFPLPVLFFGYVLVLRMFRKLHAENHTKRSRFNSVLSDVLGGMRIVKAFSREKEEIARFDRKSRELEESRLEIAVKNHTILPFLNLGMRLTSYLIWAVGGYFVLQEAITPGSGITFGVLSLFVSYLTMLYTPLNFFAHFFSQLAGGLNALQRLFEIMETPPEVCEKEDAITLSEMRGEVEFDHVSFSYTPGKKTIDDVTFHVPAGSMLGIVGHTGAGKSTLANLLTRLYDVTSGSIRIDGVDLRDLSIRTLREHVAIVSQESYLFRGSLLENIRYAKPDATVQEVIQASRAAGCHDFIMTYRDGYNTMVGQNMKKLSGGEMQRISIARAILKDPAILILDEATSAMDTKTERKIQEALSAISKGRTTITIAHRLSTLRDADALIVIENGKVAERGTHSSLLEEKGVYHKLYRLQMEAMKTIGIEE